MRHGSAPFGNRAQFGSSVLPRACADDVDRLMELAIRALSRSHSLPPPLPSLSPSPSAALSLASQCRVSRASQINLRPESTDRRHPRVVSPSLHCPFLVRLQPPSLKQKDPRWSSPLFWRFLNQTSSAPLACLPKLPMFMSTPLLIHSHCPLSWPI